MVVGLEGTHGMLGWWSCPWYLLEEDWEDRESVESAKVRVRRMSFGGEVNVLGDGEGAFTMIYRVRQVLICMHLHSPFLPPDLQQTSRSKGLAMTSMLLWSHPTEPP